MLGDPAAWRLRVDGLVAQPLDLSLDDLLRMPRVSYTVKHHCVEGWSAIASWHGVPLAAIVERCRPQPTARYISFASFDAGYTNGWDLASALRSEEHTSELQSRELISYAVFCLKKKKKTKNIKYNDANIKTNKNKKNII